MQSARAKTSVLQQNAKMYGCDVTYPRKDSQLIFTNVVIEKKNFTNYNKN